MKIDTKVLPIIKEDFETCMVTINSVGEHLLSHFNSFLPEAEEVFYQAKKKHDELYQEYMDALHNQSYDDEDTSYVDACRFSYELYLETYEKIRDAYTCVEEACNKMHKIIYEVENDLKVYFQKGNIFVDKVQNYISSLPATPDVQVGQAYEFKEGINTGNALKQVGITTNNDFQDAMRSKINNVVNNKTLNNQQKIVMLNSILTALKSTHSQSQNQSKTNLLPLNVYIGNEKDWLRKNYKQASISDSQTLSKSEKISLQEYSLDTHTDINRFLDGRPMKFDFEAYVNEISKHITNIESAIERNSLSHDTILYRGQDKHEIFPDAEDFGILSFEELKKKYINKVYEKKAFSSTSTQREVSDKRFGNCLLEIKAPCGTPAICMGNVSCYNDSEAEVLLQRNLLYRIDDIWKENEKIHVSVTIIGRRIDI